MEKIIKERLLDPKKNPTFKLLFTQKTKESKLALESFLSAILGYTVIDSIVGMNELPKLIEETDTPAELLTSAQR